MTFTLQKTLKEVLELDWIVKKQTDSPIIYYSIRRVLQQSPAQKRLQNVFIPNELYIMPRHSFSWLFV